MESTRYQRWCVHKEDGYRRERVPQQHSHSFGFGSTNDRRQDNLTLALDLVPPCKSRVSGTSNHCFSGSAQVQSFSPAKVLLRMASNGARGMLKAPCYPCQPRPPGAELIRLHDSFLDRLELWIELRRRFRLQTQCWRPEGGEVEAQEAA